MRNLEALLIAVNVVALLWPLFSGRMRRQSMIVIPSAIFLLLFAHIAFEGSRWQMWPAYLCSAVVFVGGLVGFWWFRPVPGARRRWVLAVCGSCLGLCSLALAVLASTLVPVFEFPSHGGSNPVGRRSLVAIGKGDPWLTLWFPAAETGGEPRAYALESNWPASPYGIVPAASLGHMELLASRSDASATIKNSGGDVLPLLVFFQDRNIPLGWSSYLCEELASHGYVVLGMNHAQEIGMGTQMLSYALQELRTQIEAKHIDFDKIGIIGQARGATAASRASSLPSVRAALYLAPVGEVLAPAGIASMAMVEARNTVDLPDGLSHSLRVAGFERFDFTDLAFFTSLEIEGLRGSIAAERCARITSAYALAFFAKHLLSQEAKLLDGPSPEFSEVEIK